MIRPNRTVIGAVAVLAAIAAYWFLLLAPKRDEASALAAKVSAEQSRVTQAQTTLAAYVAAKERYPSAYATVARLGKAVPADDDVRSLVVQLEHAAVRAGVDFGSIEVAAGAATATAGDATAATPPPGAVALGSAGFSAMPFALEFEGTYLRLSRLFTELERFVRTSGRSIDVDGRLLRIDDIELAPRASGSTLTAKVSLSTFLAAPAQDAPDATPPSTPSDTATAGTTSATLGALR